MSSPPVDLPLLSGQAQIWAAEVLGTIGRPYNLVWTLTFAKPEAGEAKVLAALTTLIDRHGSLRARVVSDRGVPGLRLDRRARITTHRCDANDPTGHRAHEKLLATLLDWHHDLGEDALTDFHVISGGEAVHILCVQHHVISDGLSLLLLATDLGHLVHGREPVQTVAYPEALAEALVLENEAVSMANEVATEFAAASPEPFGLAQTHSGEDAVSFDVSDRRLRIHGGSAPQLSEGTPMSIVLAAARAALRPITAHAATVIGLVVSTRPRRDDQVAGCFVNTVPLLIPAGTPSDHGSVKSIISRYLRLRHLPASALARAARLSSMDIPGAEEVAVALSPVPTSPGFRQHVQNGTSAGLTFRLWQLEKSGVASLKCPASVLDHASAAKVFTAFLEALRTPDVVGG